MSLETETWKMYHKFNVQINGENIRLIDTPISPPSEIIDLAAEDWDNLISSKAKALGSEVEVRTEKDRNSGLFLKSIYKNGKTIIYPGPSLSLQDAESDEKNAKLYVSQINYFYLRALGNNKIAELNRLGGIKSNSFVFLSNEINDMKNKFYKHQHRYYDGKIIK